MSSEWMGKKYAGWFGNSGSSGNKASDRQFLELTQTGNRFVRIDHIEKEERPYDEKEKGFHVRY